MSSSLSELFLDSEIQWRAPWQSVCVLLSLTKGNMASLEFRSRVCKERFSCLSSHLRQSLLGVCISTYYECAVSFVKCHHVYSEIWMQWERRWFLPAENCRCQDLEGSGCSDSAQSSQHGLELTVYFTLSLEAVTVFLPPSSKSWDHRYEAPYLAVTSVKSVARISISYSPFPLRLEVEPRSSRCVLNHSAASPALS